MTACDAPGQFLYHQAHTSHSHLVHDEQSLLTWNRRPYGNDQEPISRSEFPRCHTWSLASESPSADDYNWWAHGMSYRLMAMRICFPFPGDDVGGSHVNTAHTISLLQERGHDCIAFVHQEGVLSKWMEARGITYEILPWETPMPTKGVSSLVNMSRISRSTPRMRAWLRKFQFDAVVATEGRILIAWAVPTRLAGCRLIYHHQTVVAGFFMRKAASLAHKIITISQFTQDMLPDKLRPRGTIIPYPISIPSTPRSEANQYVRDAIGVAPDTTVIGVAANLTERKRPLDFVEAAARLRAPGRVFPIFGGQVDTPIVEAVQRRAQELDVVDILPLPGFLADIPERLGGFDILVAPQIEEGFGRNVAEAMAAGTPVIAANSGAHPEFVRNGETGILTPPGDVDAIVDAVNMLLNDPDLASTLGKNARDYIAQNYAPDRYGDAFNKAIT